MDEFFHRSRNKFRRAKSKEAAVEPNKTVADPSKPADIRYKNTVGLDRRDLWEDALQKLSVRDQALLRPESQFSNAVIVDDLVALVESKQKECDRRRWKFSIGGKEIILRDVAGKVITWLNKFKQLGDIAAGLDPVHAAPAWAGIKVLLEAVAADSEQMAKLLIGIEIVTYFVNRCKIYELLYLTDPGNSGDEKQTRALENLVHTLSQAYVKILEFLAVALRHYGHSTVTKVLSATFGSDTISSFADECRTLEIQVEGDASNLHRIEGRGASQEVQSSLFSLRQALDSLDEPVVRTDHRVAELWDRSNQSRQSKILQWISDIAYEESHKSTKAIRTPETGLWLLDHSQYRRWRESSASTFLWLHGIPGAGKSVLVTSVVDDILEALNGQPNDEAFAFFYCNRNSVDRRQAVSILRSFVRQLSVDRAGDALQISAVKLYNAKEKMGFSSGQLDINECKTQLLAFTGIYPQTTMVLDALDECDEETQLLLIEIFDEIVGASSKVVKVLIASRPNDNIKSRFEVGPNIGIRATDNQDDIAKFVTASLEKDSKKRRLKLSNTARDRITEALLEKSQGMFQWAVLQISQILKLKLESSILSRLGQLPEDLEKAYDEILQQVQSQAEGGTIAERTLKWIVATERRLEPNLIAALVCQDPHINALQEINVDINFVLDVCGNLVVHDTDLNRLRFAHLSVEEYLDSHGFDSGTCHEFAARVCLQILNTDWPTFAEILKENSSSDKRNSERESESESESGGDPEASITHQSAIRDQDIEFIRKNFVPSTMLPHEYSLEVLYYTWDFWFWHVWYCETRGNRDDLLELVELLVRFLGPLNESSSQYRRWHDSARDCLRGVGLIVDIYKPDISPAESAAWMACSLGFYNLLRSEWDNPDIPISRHNDSGLTMLSLAILADSIDICRKLIDLGADVNGRCEDIEADTGELGDTALFVAVSEGRFEITRLLLSHGANVDAENLRSLTALQKASRKGDKKLVTLLLDSGANINMTTGRNGTALNEAVRSGSASVVQLLVDRGADVNKTDRYSCTPLQTACTWSPPKGSPDMAALLLRLGTDINARHEVFGTALQMTVLRGHVGNAVKLLDLGADVNLTGCHHASPLQRASGDGEVGFVKTLLDHGADVNLIHGRLGTALQTAAYEGEVEIAKLLLDHGADINLNCGKYGTALQAAARQGDEEMVKLLLDYKVDVNVWGGKYGTALAAAQKNRQMEAIRALRKAGAIDQQEKDISTAQTLNAAAGRTRNQFTDDNGESLRDWFEYDTDNDTEEEEEHFARVKSLQNQAIDRSRDYNSPQPSQLESILVKESMFDKKT